MPVSDNKLDARLSQLGEGVAAYRLNHNLTQRQLAEDASVSLNALRRLESGQNTSLDTLIRVLEALELGDRLEILTPAAEVRPVDRVRLATGAERKRARPSERRAAMIWSWGDDVE